MPSNHDQQEPSDRVKQIIDELGLTQTDFSQKIGLKGRNIRNIFDKKCGVTQLLANSIELIFCYRATWILTGNGEKIDLVRKDGQSLDPDRSEWFIRSAQMSRQYAILAPQELIPCPWCNLTDQLAIWQKKEFDGTTSFSVNCGNCDIDGPMSIRLVDEKYTKEEVCGEAADLWNKKRQF